MTVSEWVKKFETLIAEAEADGVSMEPQICCCGEGLKIYRDGEWGNVL